MNIPEKEVALVTGPTGFIGSHLTRRLIRDGWTVNVVVRENSDRQLLSETSGIVAHVHDGTTENMIEIVRTAKPSIVFHLASCFIVRHQSADIKDLIASNIFFGTQLVEAMISNGVFKMINTGTSWQHFKNANYDPVNLYAATKHAFEAVLKYYIETTALNVITLKLFDTYGPDDRRPKLFNLLKQTEYRNIPLPMSQGEQLIDAVYIDDVIEAFLMAGKRLLDREHARYEEYAVSSGDPVSLRDLVRLYEKLAGKQLLINWGERPYRDREVMVPWNRGKLLPGWSPQYSLQEGLKNLRGEVHDGN